MDEVLKELEELETRLQIIEAQYKDVDDFYYLVSKGVALALAEVQQRIIKEKIKKLGIKEN